MKTHEEILAELVRYAQGKGASPDGARMAAHASMAISKPNYANLKAAALHMAGRDKYITVWQGRSCVWIGRKWSPDPHTHAIIAQDDQDLLYRIVDAAEQSVGVEAFEDIVEYHKKLAKRQ